MDYWPNPPPGKGKQIITHWQCLHEHCHAIIAKEQARAHLQTHKPSCEVAVLSDDEVFGYFTTVDPNTECAQASTECVCGQEPVKPSVVSVSEHRHGVGVTSVEVRQLPGDNYVLMIQHRDKTPPFTFSGGSDSLTLTFIPYYPPNAPAVATEPRWSVVKVHWPVGHFEVALVNQRYQSEFILARDPAKHDYDKENWQTVWDADDDGVIDD